METKETLKSVSILKEQKFQAIGIRIWELDLYKCMCIYTVYTLCLYIHNLYACMYMYVYMHIRNMLTI